MSTRHLRNISISQFESFLELALCQFKKNEKGHCQYTRADLNRPIVFQNHIDPIPEFIVKNLLRLFPYSKDDYFDILEGTKIVNRKSLKVFELINKKVSD
ncbi:hypothetical protein ACFGVS_26985 [Mucilaginibacter sp. AW1-7]|jgi:hypothetical protein|uniref:type II toxin-antitoxin system HicA family toxin n=1 Tax=unclassified Mucilaginibacter TaxID=2617802 RepID=UPI0008D02E36|nr:type II toxin-antitoxin system HicA family toxin [Mucilaginibacter sp. OK283]SEP42256.1 hypothetical protein SAMN05428947_11620 [Mucilaginibacter sp. OK283]